MLILARSGEEILTALDIRTRCRVMTPELSLFALTNFSDLRRSCPDAAKKLCGQVMPCGPPSRTTQVLPRVLQTLLQRDKIYQIGRIIIGCRARGAMRIELKDTGLASRSEADLVVRISEPGRR